MTGPLLKQLSLKLKEYFISDMNSKRLFGCSFIFCLVEILFVKYIVLTVLYPQLSSGHGLLKGLDSLRFHNHAALLANQIDGWSNFFGLLSELSLGSQMIIFIQSIIYKFVFTSHYALVPFTCLFHAWSIVLTHKIFTQLFGNRKSSLVSILPLLAFPTPLIWLTQWNKNIFFIPGCLLAIFSYVVVLKNRQAASRCALLYFIGLFLIIMSRVYFLWILLPVTLLICLYVFSKGAFLKTLDLKLAVFFSSTLVFVAVGHFVFNIASDQRLNPNVALSNPTFYGSPFISNWEVTPYIPEFLDNLAKNVANVRNSFYWVSGKVGSNIDQDYPLKNARNVFSYWARALEVNFFAPFAYQWFDTTVNGKSQLMRKLVAFEMIFSYISYFGLVFLLLNFKNVKDEIWVVLIFAVGCSYFYTYCIPNIGTWYRIRFVFHALTISTGFTALIVHKKEINKGLKKLFKLTNQLKSR